MTKKAFTLIELLVVISIIGILVALSMFGFANARKNGRDAKRKSDLEQIRSALEFYKSDVGNYPNSINFGGSLSYGGNIYMQTIPNDPISTKDYTYTLTDGSYTICATLESDSSNYCKANP